MKTASYLLRTGMCQVQDTCNPGRWRRYLRPTAIQTSALVLSESSDKETSDSDATWGWCSDSNDQGQAEQVAQSQIIVRLGGGPSNQPGVGSRGGPKALGRSSSACLWSHSCRWWGKLQRERGLFWLVASIEFVLLANCSPSLPNPSICFLSLGYSWVRKREKEGKEGISMVTLC